MPVPESFQLNCEKIDPDASQQEQLFFWQYLDTFIVATVTLDCEQSLFLSDCKCESLRARYRKERGTACSLQ